VITGGRNGGKRFRKNKEGRGYFRGRGTISCHDQSLLHGHKIQMETERRESRHGTSGGVHRKRGREKRQKKKDRVWGGHILARNTKNLRKEREGREVRTNKFTAVFESKKRKDEKFKGGGGRGREEQENWHEYSGNREQRKDQKQKSLGRRGKKKKIIGDRTAGLNSVSMLAPGQKTRKRGPHHLD